jgi:hypothetical protein
MKIKLINSAIIIHFFVLIGVFFSCKSSKKIVTNNEKIKVSNSNQSISNISARTKQFLTELEKELNGENISEFIPSKRLIDEYSIYKIKNEFFISGFVKINEKFDKSICENSSVQFGQPSGQITTVNIPLNYLSDFLKMSGIEYFEISEKVQTK